MVVVPLAKPIDDFDEAPSAERAGRRELGPDCLGRYPGGQRSAAAQRKRRLGLVAAATGTTLALLDQQDVLRDWWKILPNYIEEVQYLLSQVQGTVDEVSNQREKLGRVWAVAPLLEPQLPASGFADAVGRPFGSQTRST